MVPGGWGLVLLLLCIPALARTVDETREAHGGNCVAYAREVTGINLDGDAASWWPHAEGHYNRGHQPSVGAVLVFKPYGGMHVGHVAVVSRVINAREVLVDQANWVRGRVTHAMSVIDASPLNDWTSVKVEYGGTHGRENPTYGFIYPSAPPANFGDTIVDPLLAERPHASHPLRLADWVTPGKPEPKQDDVELMATKAPAHLAAVATAPDKPIVAAKAPDHTVVVAKAPDKGEHAGKQLAKADTTAAPDKGAHARKQLAKADTAPAPDKVEHPKKQIAKTEPITASQKPPHAATTTATKGPKAPPHLADNAPPHREQKPRNTRLASVHF
jgi:surface antigen